MSRRKDGTSPRVAISLLGAVCAVGASGAAPRLPAPQVAAECAGDPADPSVLAFYPPEARAAGLEGDAQVTCARFERGALRSCSVVAEHPSGRGFGAAALAMLASSSENPAADYAPNRPGALRNISVRFRLNPLSVTPNLTGQAHVIEEPAVVKQPDPNRIAMAYPVRSAAMGAQGVVILHCSVRLTGALDDCQATTPVGSPDKDLTRAALGLAPEFRASPLKCDGKPVDAAKLNIPVIFKWGRQSDDTLVGLR